NPPSDPPISRPGLPRVSMTVLPASASGRVRSALRIARNNRGRRIVKDGEPPGHGGGPPGAGRCAGVARPPTSTPQAGPTDRPHGRNPLPRAGVAPLDPHRSPSESEVMRRRMYPAGRSTPCVRTEYALRSLRRAAVLAGALAILT